MARSTYKNKKRSLRTKSKRSLRGGARKSKSSKRSLRGGSRKSSKKSKKQRGGNYGSGASKSKGSIYGAGVYWPAGLARPF